MSATGEKAVDQAQNFSGGVIAAARRRDRWGRLEANATDDETREQYREAIADLSSRFPDLEDVPIGGAEAFARERGHGSSSRSPIHEGRRRKAAPAKSAKPASRPKPAAAGPKVKGDFPKPTPGLGPGARRGPSQAAGAPTPRLDRAIRRTGIPAAVDSGGSAVLAGVGMTVGLSLAFLLFSSAEKPGSGTAALPSLVNGVTKGIGRFISLGDVFPSNAGAARVQAAPISRNQARRQGRSLLGEVPQLPPAHHLKKSKGYKFPPQYVTKGGG